MVDQIQAIATRLYGADGIDLQMQAQKDLERLDKLGLGTALVCMAKTHLSLSHEPTLRNRPKGFILPVRGLVPSAGAGFVVALCGEMQRMPGLGKTPAFMNIDIDADGQNGRVVLGAQACPDWRRRWLWGGEATTNRQLTCFEPAGWPGS